MQDDSYFAIGSTHQVCEDYALSGSFGDKYYAIVCDGCSSSPLTDVGARILAHTARNTIAKRSAEDIVEKSSEVIGQIIWQAVSTVRQLQLPSTCLDATLLMAVTDEEKVHIFLAGDGQAVIRNRDGRVEIVRTHYHQGAPAYLNYLTDPKRKQLYKDTFDRGKADLSWSVLQQKESLYPDAHLTGVGPFCFSLSIKDWDLVLLMSDGVEQFQRPDEGYNYTKDEDVEADDVVSALLQFKGYRGEFITRRCKRQLKQWHKLGWQHRDDFSVAGIYLGTTNASSS